MGNVGIGVRDEHACEVGVQLWRALGAGPGETEELLAYAQDCFDHTALPERYPLPDEAFVASWQDCLRDAEARGVFPALCERLIQLRFPIAGGVSTSAVYLGAIRRGQLPPGWTATIALERPAELRLALHATPAGRVPVIVAAARADFVTLVQAFTRGNEPTPVPDAMGACIVAGYNNWGRVAERRREWEAGQASWTDARDWAAAFRALVPHKALYQDRFIILSTGPYSATPAARLGLDDETWLRHSAMIRLEHECTHYFTRQVLGSMRNVLSDELVADYMGTVAAAGRYQRAWLEHGFGLEDFPRYRPGARLENYRGSPPLSDGAFRVLQAAVIRAAANLETIDSIRHAARAGALPCDDAAEKAAVIVALTQLGLAGLAADDAPVRFQQLLRS